ncbi:MAG: hypothetical protein HY306_08060 [Nitrosomonadales bacterium]|nr:hypothetical protein [Nitrosomonadales bacterium]
MIRLERALRAWGTADFMGTLKLEIEQLGAEQLPLYQGLTSSNHVADEAISVMIHSVTELEKVIRVKAGIFYKGMLVGCSCADDPGPPGESNEYCEVQLDIDKASAAAEVVLVVDE